MSQHFEIEFKNALTEKEYEQIMDGEFNNSSQDKRITFQTNYYFDTIEQVLKNQGSVLRIRVTNSTNELTFKVPHQGFLMETNYHLNDDECAKIIQSKQIVLSSYLSPKDSIPNLVDISKETVFYLFNQFETKRFEKEIDEHVLVLDRTTFQNDIVDYELEVESTDAEKGEFFFDSFLNKYHISKKPSLPKIARAEKMGNRFRY